MYVQALETNYNDTIRDLKQMIEKERMRNKKIYHERANETCMKNELENLFVECIEEIRKDIMKRRLKNEIFNKKKFQQIDKNSEEAKEFEQSLLKLAQLAKSRVKISEFTAKDRNNLLDLFVNNERTLLKIYEILFPHRASPNVGAGVSNQMVAESGNGIYG
jgi:neutral trehalase